jgi:hypothetical protein
MAGRASQAIGMGDQTKTKKCERAAKLERLAQALRENLKRRKAQARGRSQEMEKGASGSERAKEN